MFSEKEEKMSWVKIFEGVVMGDEVKVEWFVDDDFDGEYDVKVTATDKNPPQITPPIIGEGSAIIPLPPHDPAKKFTFEYDSIDEMYEKFAGESGRPEEFSRELEKAIQNY